MLIIVLESSQYTPPWIDLCSLSLGGATQASEQFPSDGPTPPTQCCCNSHGPTALPATRQYVSHGLITQCLCNTEATVKCLKTNLSEVLGEVKQVCLFVCRHRVSLCNGPSYPRTLFVNEAASNSEIQLPLCAGIKSLYHHTWRAIKKKKL